LYAFDMQVDANHDGKIDDFDRTSTGRPLVFWVNDDKDNTFDPSDPESTESKNGIFDSSFIGVSSQRDLEDYARLWISGIPQLPLSPNESWQLRLSWENDQGPTIRVCDAVDHDETGKLDGG